jgi:hypothetical protein
MGPKIGEFGIFQANGTAPPPVVTQPKYIVMNVPINGTETGGVSVIGCNINTSGVNLSEYQWVGSNYLITFDGDFCTTGDNVYIETEFYSSFVTSGQVTIPLYQITTDGFNAIQFSCANIDNTLVAVNGTLKIMVMIFEV